MSFGGYGGSSADPFGGQPSGGGWSGPPTYQAPPPSPPSQQTNPLATLSIVFAFLFAPAGVVLGHVALSQIKRLHQKGRDRAIIGLVLSYFMIVVVVAALVVGAALPTDEPTSAVADATTSAAPVNGATTTEAAVPVTGANLTDVLLNGGELAALLGQRFKPSADHRLVGALDAMPNAFPDEATASPHECIGATHVTQRSTYESSSVQNFAFEDWWTSDIGPVLAVTEAVVVLSSRAEAEAAFDKFAQQWQACEGRTVTLLAAPTSASGGHYVVTANAVQVADHVLSAVLASDHSDGGSARASARTLGVKGNCVVEVEVSMSGVAPGKDPMSGRDTSGIDVARAILARIA
ncbi:LppR protein [Mycolicibacterium mageritense DSM 44476 = CIP 104973]|uniref:DUF4190 domain-containing protein n=3 Tax=Mycolicibacterium TaxID=1866885 RepID=A0AAI8XS95_MYCME|nr:sensor domain-containing protein [Mycolicibacterium mageritense]BBX38231.1 hypothetical protein MMAGJ_75130 [Mycolicibacterium mageritense]BDY32875.1 hypothetical protein hbim_06847 [Mycolicibacterium mageritense]CDO27035.1 LppR protein [Mycolicibacterium mageritense DSM 44476 = CIP 104973]